MSSPDVRRAARGVCALMVACWLSFSAASLVAQEEPGVETVEVTEAQAELNEQGVAAVNSGNFQVAINLFKASLNLGELNITYLNLGRAYAKAGLCDEAIAAYDATTTAPRVSSPPAEVIAEAVARFRDQLPEQCPGKVRVVCVPGEMLLRVDDQEAIPCPDEPLTLAPGPHVLIGSLDALQVEARVDVVALEEVSITLEVPSEASSGPDSQASAAPRDRLWQVVGWSGLSVGAAALLAAVVVDVAVIAPAIDDAEAELEALNRGEVGSQEQFDELRQRAERLQRVNRAMIIGGGGMAALGLTALLIDLFGEPEESHDADVTAHSVAPAPLRGGGVGVFWQTSW